MQGLLWIRRGGAGNGHTDSMSNDEKSPTNDYEQQGFHEYLDDRNLTYTTNKRAKTFYTAADDELRHVNLKCFARCLVQTYKVVDTGSLCSA